MSVDDDQSIGYQAVHIDYSYRVPPTRLPGDFEPAIAIIEAQNRGGEKVLVMSGRHKVFDGIEVVTNAPPLAPGMEWIQDQTRFELVTGLTWDDTLRIYHSMVTGSSTCGLPDAG